MFVQASHRVMKTVLYLLLLLYHPQMCANTELMSPQSSLVHMRSYAENSSIHGEILCILLLCLLRGNCAFCLIVISAGVQYLLSKSVVSRIIWFILVIFALAGAAYFSENIFTDWQVVLLLLLLSLGHGRPSAGMALLDLRVVTSPGE